MNTTKTETKTIFAIDGELRQAARKFARLKRREKMIADGLEAVRTVILGITGTPATGETIIVASSGASTAEKLLSITGQTGRAGIDSKRLASEWPEAFADCAKIGSPSTVIRCH